MDSNQIIISQLKNTILTIYKKINEKSHNIHDSNNTNSYMSTESSSKNIHNFGYKKIVYQNGNIYEGELKNGKKHGKGIMKYKNGYIYDGDWENGYRHGKEFISKKMVQCLNHMKVNLI